MIQIEIDANGGVAMLHDDAVNLAELGDLTVTRASHVEYDAGADRHDQHLGIERGWYVQSAKTGVVLKSGFSTRAEALAWEKTHYSPSGLGWAELKGE